MHVRSSFQQKSDHLQRAPLDGVNQGRWERSSSSVHVRSVIEKPPRDAEAPLAGGMIKRGHGKTVNCVYLVSGCNEEFHHFHVVVPGRIVQPRISKVFVTEQLRVVR